MIGKKRAIHRLSPLFLGLCVFAMPTVSHATVSCIQPNGNAKFIYVARQLSGGFQHRIETTNISGDTVLHLLTGSTGTNKQVAADDDSNGGHASLLFYTPPTTGTYFILVRSYQTGSGVADVKVDGTTILTQNTYGSNVVTGASWTNTEAIRATSTLRNSSQDTMLFLATGTASIFLGDDDSGPNLYSLAFPAQNATASSKMIYASFPATNPTSIRLTIQPPSGAPDADGDLVPDSVETACGLNPNKSDTDADALPDSGELWGNNGFSFSPSNFADAPTRRNAYVEIDAMNSPKVPAPYAGLPLDMLTIFNAQPNTIDAYVEQETSPSLPYFGALAVNSCGTQPNCVTIPTLQNTYFSVGAPERKPYFHYVVFGDQLYDPFGGLVCNSGQAPLLGQKVAVTLGTGSGACGGGNTSAIKRGTTMHELGHNLNLVHNQNDDVNGNWSTIHNSIMNYRYQFSGVPGVVGVLAHTYSYGTNPAAPCSTSPKYRCLLAQYYAVLIYGTPGACTLVDPVCDTDVQEWNQWLTTDFVAGTQNPNLGAPPEGAQMNMSDSNSADALQALSDADQAAIAEAFARNQASPGKGILKQLDNDQWIGPVPEVTATHKRAVVQGVVDRVKMRGLVQNRDFFVSDDGLDVTQRCR